MDVATPAGTSLAIRILGTFEVTVDGQPVTEDSWPRRKAQLLVRLLALTPAHQLHREQIVEALYPESEPSEGLRSLHKALHFARRALEPALPARMESRFLITKDQSVELAAPEGLWVDADEFEEAGERALRLGDASLAEQALALYGGDLLPQDIYECWATDRREQLRMLRLRLLSAFAKIAAESGSGTRATELLVSLVAADPTNEAVHRRLMRLYWEGGDRRLALEQYSCCRAILERELDVEPDDETNDLRDAIAASLSETLEAERSPQHAPPEASELEGQHPPVDHLTSASRRPSRIWLLAAVVVLLGLSAGVWLAIDSGRASRIVPGAWIGGTADADRKLVTLTGKVSGPVSRVEILDSPSGWASLVGSDGTFLVRDVQWKPGDDLDAVLTASTGAEVLVNYRVPDQYPTDGPLYVGHFVFSRGRSVTEADQQRRRSIHYQDFDVANIAYYLGACDVVAGGKSSDAGVAIALNTFVASRYLSSGYPAGEGTPRRTLELGAGLSGQLTQAMATLARASGFDTRVVEMTDAGESNLVHAVVEVYYDGGWHLFDPAFGVYFAKSDGSVASYEDLRSDPTLVDPRSFEKNYRHGWNASGVANLYSTGIHHYVLFRESNLDETLGPYRTKPGAR